ncbi:MAG: class I SAM-dependent methyltransferase [Candidatus Dormibacteraeota bacterium]|nr:class I SAM-dependent methyltransferase [Candidatus Dormibacteraeota bacterium]
MNPASGSSTLDTMEGAHRYNRWVFDRIRDGLGQRVLEIGCGTGTITSFLVERQLVVGIDVVDDYIHSTSERYRDRANVIICRHDLTESIEPLQGHRFDSAVSVNVFEHIANDEAAMKAVYTLLEPGGSFTVLVPCHPRLLGAFDRDIGHHRRYSKAELRRKLEASGFVVERIRRSNPVGALGWLVNVRLLGLRQLRGARLFDRLVPILAVLDRIELPVGLSLIAVARKPGAIQQAPANREIQPAA